MSLWCTVKGLFQWQLQAGSPNKQDSQHCPPGGCDISLHPTLGTIPPFSDPSQPFSVGRSEIQVCSVAPMLYDIEQLSFFEHVKFDIYAVCFAVGCLTGMANLRLTSQVYGHTLAPVGLVSAIYVTAYTIYHLQRANATQQQGPADSWRQVSVHDTSQCRRVGDANSL